MKKLFYALGAMMLLGLFSACVDPMTGGDENYDPVKDAVTTQLVINIAPADTDAKTKQTAEAVQINQNFRGLGNATLFTMTLTNGNIGKSGTPDALADGYMMPWVQNGTTHRKATSYIPLSQFLLANTIDPTGDGTTVPKSRRVIEISLPKETNSLLFYGEAVTGTDADALNAYGGIGYNMGFDDAGLVDLASIYSYATPRLPQYAEGSTTTLSQKAKDFETIETIIIMIINRLFEVGVNGTHGWDQQEITGYMKKAGTTDQYWDTYNFGTGDSRVQLHWKDFAGCVDNSSDSPLYSIFHAGTPMKASQLEIILGTAYNAFVTMDPAELRSGAGAAVARQATDLYSVMAAANASTALNEQEEVAKVIITEILKGLMLFFDTTNPASLTWFSLYDTQTQDGVLKSLKTRFGYDIAAPSNTNLTLQDFPFHFDLPMGATTLLRAASDSIFCYNTENISLGGMGGGTMSVYDYTYPPSLTYYGNAPVRISTSNDLTRSKFPDGTGDWENDGKWSEWGSVWNTGYGHVTSDTRGVAMAYNIQYGNALLVSTVKYGDDVHTNGNKLVDNYGGIAGHTGEPNKEYSITDGTIALTGILIGGQPNKVGWTYMGVSDATYNKMIYDKSINGGTRTEDGDVWKYVLTIPNTEETTPNYTVVYDNYNAADAQSDVYVALEFQNNLGKDFWGNANMVRNGGTFYILAKLPLSAVTDEKWNVVKSNFSKIQPPYDVNDGVVTTKDVKRVFVQNCKTTATFVIGKDSLKHAYVTVPDLRASKMSIGISVDLNWDNGVDFGDIVLGQ